MVEALFAAISSSERHSSLMDPMLQPLQEASSQGNPVQQFRRERCMSIFSAFPTTVQEVLLQAALSEQLRHVIGLRMRKKKILIAAMM